MSRRIVLCNDTRVNSQRCSIDDLRELIARHCTGKQLNTDVRGLTLYRAEATVERIPTSYWPALCVLAQGVKQVVVGNRVYQYDPLNYLIVTVGLPVTARIAKASVEQPLLGLTFDLDPLHIGELMLEMPIDKSRSVQAAALAVSGIDDQLLGAVTRLVHLLDDPEDAAILAPLIEREILYRLLRGKHASLLRDVVSAGSHLSQIARATDWIRSHYSERVRIDDLADLADMSVTSFHRHFKAITAMSPLQYRTQTRLQVARRLMLVDADNASAIALGVGYESVSQFSRDYRRTFGMPPAADAARLRNNLAAQAAMI
jgi:AraC-like DNA-binding protein